MPCICEELEHLEATTVISTRHPHRKQLTRIELFE